MKFFIGLYLIVAILIATMPGTNAQTEPVEDILEEIDGIVCVTVFSGSDRVDGNGAVASWRPDSSGGGVGAGIGIQDSDSSYLVIGVANGGDLCPEPEGDAIGNAAVYWAGFIATEAWELIFGQSP